MRFPFLKAKSGSVGLAFSRRGTLVTAASIMRESGKPRLSNCMMHTLSGNTPAGWKALSKSLGGARGSAVMLLAQNEYQLFQVDAPSVPEEEVKSAVKWKLRELLSFPLEQATVDVINIPTDKNAPGRARFVYAVAAQNEAIKRCMSNSKSAGVNVKVIDIPEMAQRNIASLLEERGQGVALLTFTDDGGLLTFTADGELYHARQIEITGLQLAVEDEGQRQHHFERLGAVLQHSFDSFERQLNYVPVNRLVLGPMAEQSILEDYLRANLDIQVESLDLTAVLNLAAVKGMNDLAMQAKCFHAIGAALRSEEG